MKSLWFVPFTYVAGVDGFAFFAPYLILVLTTAGVVMHLRRRRVALATAS